MSIGNFLRKLSIDTEKSATLAETGEQSREGTTMTSILQAPSKLLTSVNEKTGHLVSDLNQKLDISGKLDSIKNASVNTFESVIHPSGGSKEAGQRAEETQSHTRSDTTSFRRQSTNAGPKPPRPPPPSLAAMNRAMSLDESSLSRAPYKPKFNAPRLEPSSELEEERGFRVGPNEPTRQPIEGESDSSASEYGEHGDHPIYKSDDDETSPEKQPDPVINLEERHEEIPANMDRALDQAVSAILNVCLKEIADTRKELRTILQTCVGRMAFVNSLEQEAMRSQGQLNPDALPELLDTISYFLGQCQDAEDFAPAKKLLKTSLSFYIPDQSKPNEQTFLFAYIKTQPIWQTLRFWNACFFHSLQEARGKVAEQASPEKTTEQITYEQLQSYLNTMNVFELHSTIKHEFLRKQSNLFNLTDDEFQSLRSIISD